jgi:hypothetical protein
MKGEIHRLTCVQPDRKKQMKRKETIAEPLKQKMDKNTSETVLSFRPSRGGDRTEGGGGVRCSTHLQNSGVCDRELFRKPSSAAACLTFWKRLIAFLFFEFGAASYRRNDKGESSPERR